MRLRGTLNSKLVDVRIDGENFTGEGAEILHAEVQAHAAEGYVVTIPGRFGGPVSFDSPISIVALFDELGEIELVEGAPPAARIPPDAEA